MTKHFYVFGSLCRGEIDQYSDVDLLACVSGESSPNIDKSKFSVYTHSRLEALWQEGNPFAWHLSLESRLVFSSDGSDFIVELGSPQKYKKMYDDCSKFMKLFNESYNALLEDVSSRVFHLSCMFLAMRNFATCYSLGLGKPIFSRYSPLMIDDAIKLNKEVFDLFVQARILSTRGLGDNLNSNDIKIMSENAPQILNWMNRIMLGINHE